MLCAPLQGGAVRQRAKMRVSVREAASGLEVGVAAVVIVLAVIGASLWVVTTPACVSILVRAVDSAQATGMGKQATLDVAEHVRRFVVDPATPALPSTIDGVPAFDDAAVSHLIDVRDVLVPVRWLTLVVLAAIALWLPLRLRSASGRRVVVISGMAAAATVGVASMLAVAAGIIDFNGLFTWFHSLLFAEGTWVFPASALLIRVFPLPFWIAAGAVWGLCVLILSAVLCWFVRRLRFTEGTYGV